MKLPGTWSYLVHEATWYMKLTGTWSYLVQEATWYMKLPSTWSCLVYMKLPGTFSYLVHEAFILGVITASFLCCVQLSKLVLPSSGFPLLRKNKCYEIRWTYSYVEDSNDVREWGKATWNVGGKRCFIMHPNLNKWLCIKCSWYKPLFSSL